VFKYYDFFATSFADSIAKLGFEVHPWTLKIILPVGISFYTFHGLSYVIDVYKDRIRAEKNFVDYSVFVSFFPLLVAGPIERATHLLPQIKQERSFDYAKAVVGLRQILWGLFKKIVIADQCAEYTQLIYSNSENHSGSTIILGQILFSFQIYGDFSGYSDIALGTAKLFGIDLLRNFAFPYFSRDVAEYWRRWHISLSSWFKDYLYVPLGGSKAGMWKKVRNTFIIFLVSGFWHGANWTYVIWGFLNAIWVMPSVLFKSKHKNLDIVAKGKLLPGFRDVIMMGITFGLVSFGWIFFRAEDLGHSWAMLTRVFSLSSFRIPEIMPFRVFALLAFFMFIEWTGREGQFAIDHLGEKWRRPFRWAFYFLLIMAIFIFNGKEQQFIYFQF
jgi:D-alanyl-lipoteichoic acid acyltransferase DltB (MBOAT superfamily)